MEQLVNGIGYAMDYGKFFILPVIIYAMVKTIDEVYQVITLRTRLDDGDDE
jgi:hypothetical protein